MHKVINARSIRFSEHKDSGQDFETAQVIKQQQRNKGQHHEAQSTSKFGIQRKFRTEEANPDIVNNIIQKEATRTNRDQRGVWSTTGERYQQHGVPDLELSKWSFGELTSKIRHHEAEEDLDEGARSSPSIQLSNCLKAINDCRSKINGPVNGANHHRQNHHKNNKERPKTAGAIPSRHHHQKKHKTLQLLERLGNTGMTPTYEDESKSLELQDQEREYARMKKHLMRTDSVSERWRNKFKQVEESANQELLKKVVEHQKYKEKVLSQPKLLATAEYLVSNREKLTREPSVNNLYPEEEEIYYHAQHQAFVGGSKLGVWLVINPNNPNNPLITIYNQFVYNNSALEIS